MLPIHSYIHALLVLGPTHRLGVQSGDDGDQPGQVALLDRERDLCARKQTRVHVCVVIAEEVRLRLSTTAALSVCEELLAGGRLGCSPLAPCPSHGPSGPSRLPSGGGMVLTVRVRRGVLPPPQLRSGVAAAQLAEPRMPIRVSAALRRVCSGRALPSCVAGRVITLACSTVHRALYVLNPNHALRRNSNWIVSRSYPTSFVVTVPTSLISLSTCADIILKNSKPKSITG